MSLSLVQSRALLGLNAANVTVEVHLANGLPSFTLVGLADVEVKEARVSRKIPHAHATYTNQRLTSLFRTSHAHVKPHKTVQSNFLFAFKKWHIRRRQKAKHCHCYSTS